MLEPTSRALWGRGAGCSSGVETTSRALWGRCAGCLSGVETCLLGTVGQGCRLFKWCQSLPPEHFGYRGRLFKPCQNLPPGHCGAGVQAVLVKLEPISEALWGRCAGCLSGARTHLPGTVRQWCRLFKQCRKPPSGHCGAGVQAV